MKNLGHLYFLHKLKIFFSIDLLLGVLLFANELAYSYCQLVALTKNFMIFVPIYLYRGGRKDPLKKFFRQLLLTGGSFEIERAINSEEL